MLGWSGCLMAGAGEGGSLWTPRWGTENLLCFRGKPVRPLSLQAWMARQTAPSAHSWALRQLASDSALCSPT